MLRVLGALVALGVLALAGAALWARGAIADSLPRNAGVRTVSGLAREVAIEFDERGVPTITAATVEDAAFALGFVHARDRYFQMDVYRRLAAGDLGGLFGAGVLPIDRARIVHDFRRVSGEVLEAIPARHRAQVEAYTLGVRAGLADLGRPPPEYLLLGRPMPWSERDCVLSQFTMFDGLNFSAESELEVDALARALPPEVVEFLTPDATRNDSLLRGGGGGAASDYAPAPIPGALSPANPGSIDAVGMMFNESLGSNNWAVAGSRTRDGRAILANDPHLELGTPSVWYRARLKWTTPEGRAVDVLGVTLPGFPGMLIGSTPDFAWGFTNSGADQEDMVLVEPDPADGSLYLTDDGPKAFEIRSMQHCASGEEIQVRTTRWGPIVRTAGGRMYAKRWVAHDPDKVNFNLLDLPEAGTIEEAAAIARSWHGPSQNVLLADAHGRIAWTLSGFVPRRSGFDGKRPAAWRAGVGWVGEGEKPATIIDPPEGVLWTANNRTLAADESRALARMWMLPDRARRIADLLAARPTHDEASLAAIQLDTRARGMDAYRGLALAACGDDAGLAPARAAIESWNGHADADQRGYPILVAFRARLRAELLGPIVAPARSVDPAFRFTWPLSEEAVLRLVEERPAHALAAGDSWESLVRRSLEGALADLRSAGLGVEATWGEANLARLQHPISRAIPALSGYLDMPRDPMSGDMNVVRVTRGRFGASMRMVVSPGRWQDAILQTPAGQSGHVLSAHYASFHGEWMAGEPTPMMPGRAAATLRLAPRKPGDR